MGLGDHIKVYRFGYWHHEIDLGNGKVVHYTGESGRKDDAEIKITDMKDFLYRGKLETERYNGKKCFAPQIVRERALSRIGEKRYSLFFRNCEHFARWCKMGKKRCKQMSNPVSENISGILSGFETKNEELRLLIKNNKNHQSQIIRGEKPKCEQIIEPVCEKKSKKGNRIISSIKGLFETKNNELRLLKNNIKIYNRQK